MKNHTARHDQLKYLSPDNLKEQISKFTSGMAVTHGKFELMVPMCTLQDFEWNHMDQMHRFSIHNTYEKNVRVAFGPDFAVSLTQWGKWPLFISVSDVYVARGLFYQTMTIAGIFVLHSIISMEEIEGQDSVKLTDEWYIGSHKIFRFMHNFLNKKLHKLNVRLQQEDEQLRQGRFKLRQKGYQFKTDKPDYYNSNRLTNNTIYPRLAEGAAIVLDDVTSTTCTKMAGDLEFIVKKADAETYHVWPAACPHEGGPLAAGKVCDAQIVCPWHGLRFSAVVLSPQAPLGTRHGFEYFLQDNKIFVKKIAVSMESSQEILMATDSAV
jgi:hypothetical protein